MSLFFTKYPFNVPLLAFEHLNSLLDLPPIEAISNTLLNVCGTQPNEDSIDYFLKRNKEYLESKEVSSGKENKETTNKITLGTYFNRFIMSLDPSTVLVLATGYDIDKARKLYCEEDFSVAESVIKTYIKLMDEQNNYAYEVALYGAGGSYKEDAKQEESIPMDTLSIEDINALQQW
jgi:hypothetical protein